MLGFRPKLSVAKRKPQGYNQAEPRDLEDGEYAEKRYDSDDDGDYTSSAASSPYSSRASSGTYDVNPNNVVHETRPLASNRKPSRTHGRTPSKPKVSAYSYRNPRAFTRYFGLAIASTLVLFMWFLVHSSWTRYGMLN